MGSDHGSDGSSDCGGSNWKDQCVNLSTINWGMSLSHGSHLSVVPATEVSEGLSVSCSSGATG